MLNVAIVGYGNLGKGVEKELKKRKDANIVGIFSRRNPETLDTKSQAYHLDDILKFKDEIDVCIMCGGSAHDLPTQTPYLSQFFNTVDSYDNHDLIKEHKNNVDDKTDKTTSIISVGWDPGIFSLQRLYIESILGVSNHTFWGEGVSQGHSDALRQIDGVIDAIQVTVPLKEAINQAKQGQQALKNKHKRIAYVVTNRKDKEKLKEEIKTMPHYFAPFETEVYFLTQKELNDKFPSMPHGGHVIGSDGKSQIEFSLDLKSNPDFTSQVLVAYAYACATMNKKGYYGAYTIFDVAPKYLSKDRFDIL